MPMPLASHRGTGEAPVATRASMKC